MTTRCRHCALTLPSTNHYKHSSDLFLNQKEKKTAFLFLLVSLIPRKRTDKTYLGLELNQNMWLMFINLHFLLSFTKISGVNCTLKRRRPSLWTMGAACCDLCCRWWCGAPTDVEKGRTFATSGPQDQKTFQEEKVPSRCVIFSDVSHSRWSRVWSQELI